MVRYADDFVVLCRSAEQAQAALAEVKAWVETNGLSLNAEKTHVGDCRQEGQGFEFLGYRFEAGRRWVRREEPQGRCESGFGSRPSAREEIVWQPLLQNSIRCCAVGLTTSSTLIRMTFSGMPTALRVGGCGRFCVSRRSGPGWVSVWTIIKGGPKLSLPTWDFSQ